MSFFGDRPTGARIYWWDPFVLLATAALTLWLASLVGHLAILPALVVGHFFLFCNVFRVRTRLELIWAGIFLMVVAVANVTGHLQGGLIAALITPVTLAVLWSTVRAPATTAWAPNPRRACHTKATAES